MIFVELISQTIETPFSAYACLSVSALGAFILDYRTVLKTALAVVDDCIIVWEERSIS